MTSYLEQVVENLGSIVPLMTAGLAEVREKDKHTRNLLKAIYNEEGQLMEELKELAKNGPDFDEEPLKAKAQSLATRRQYAALQLEDQNKFAMSLYQKLDEKIKNFGASLFVNQHVSILVIIRPNVSCCCSFFHFVSVYHSCRYFQQKYCPFVPGWIRKLSRGMSFVDF